MPAPHSPPATAPRDDIELRQVARRLRPFALWIGLATASAMVAAHLSSSAQPPVYEATTSLMSVGGSAPSLPELSISAPPLTPIAVEQVLHSTQFTEDLLRRLPATALPAEVVRTLSADLRAEVASQRFEHLRLRSRVDQQQRGVYDLLARAETAQTAKTLAGLSARTLLAWDADRARQRYRRARHSLEAQIRATAGPPLGQGAREQMIQDIWQLRLLESAATGTLTLVAQPVTPGRPLSPRPRRDAALAGLLALLGSSGLALLIGGWRRRVRGAADLQHLNLAVLAELPLPARRAAPQGGQGIVAASQRGPLLGALGHLRLRLLPLLARAPQATVIVSDTGREGGASLVVAALAANLGASGLKVLVVDAQLGRPQQRLLWPLHVAPWHPLPGAQLNLAYGVATTLSQACLNPQVAQAARVSSHVDVLPADETGNPGALPDPAHQASPLHQNNFPELLRLWASAYDVVLVDAPSLWTGPDALGAAPGTAGVLLVADVAGARLHDVEQVLDLAATTGAPVLGCVLTRPRHLRAAAPAGLPVRHTPAETPREDGGQAAPGHPSRI